MAEADPIGPSGGTRRPPRLELLIAIAIAAVSLAAAVAAWRTSDVGSKAGDAERQGLIEAVQEQSLANEDWRLVFEEAANAQRYFAAEAEAQAIDRSGEAIGRAQAASLRQYLLPSLALLAGPLATQQRYWNADGSLDLERRYADVHEETLRTSAPDPQEAFDRADRVHNQQRWLVVATVLLAGSLFWLALAEIARDRTRAIALTLGLALLVVGVLWFAGVEIGFSLAALVAS